MKVKTDWRYLDDVRRVSAYAESAHIDPEIDCRVSANVGDIMAAALAAADQGKVYHPHFRKRLPEWATLGQRVLDPRSQWLDVNLTASQRAYARELAIERSRQH